MSKLVSCLMLCLLAGLAQAKDNVVELNKEEATGEAIQCMKIIAKETNVKLDDFTFDDLVRMTVDHYSIEINGRSLYPIEYIDCDSKLWKGVKSDFFK